MLAQRRQLGVREDHVLAHVLGVRARVADPFDARDRVDPAQQLGEGGRGSQRQVASVRVDVLAEQRDLGDAVGGQPFELGDQHVRVAADLAATRRRNDAVGAHAVAADADLQPALELPRTFDRQVAGERLELEEPLRA